MLESTIHEWTHGPRIFLLIYANVTLPMLVVQFRARSPIVAWWRSVLTSVPLTLIGVLIIVLAAWLLSSIGVTGDGFFSWLFSVGFLALLGYSSGQVIAGDLVSNSNSVYRRGAVVSNAKVLFNRRRARRWGLGGNGIPDPKKLITLAGIPVAVEDETKHFKCIGTTGTGKSTAITEILTAALARGDRAVIADPDGGFAGKVLLGSHDGAARSAILLRGMLR